MVFGEGYASPLDVTAHEVTHAITERTAGLDYQGESGALNESISDIFGANLDPDDHGGVHTNSGIPNHAYYLMAQSMRRDAAAQVVFDAVAQHLDHDSGFEDFRSACLQVAADRYGKGSAQYRHVDASFAAVGLDGHWEAPE